ncbi:MAG: PilZ domain-containing protein [Oscillospiraceae bacterium]|nr:PilZ domain-containing protein [Oscillospiraceae bacterium]
MQGQDKIKKIEIYEQNKLFLECTKNYSFPVKYIDDKPVDNILMIKGKKMPMLSKGTPVNVIINTKGGDRIRYACKIDMSSPDQLNVTLNSANRQELEDKRRYYKIKTEINCRVADVTKNGEVRAYNPNLYGKIQDINIGGVFIVVLDGEEYVKGDILSFTTILGDARLEASAKVLRVQRTPEGEINGYGCAFISVSSAQEEMISSYVNYLQMEERKLEREKELLEKEMHG